MFDHSNIVPHHSLNKIIDALDGIQLGDTPNALQTAALKLLAVRYRKTNVSDQGMINLWLNGPDAGQPVVELAVPVAEPYHSEAVLQTVVQHQGLLRVLPQGLLR